ncbi:MAG: type II toxin-antitoxin system HicA family toxin [Chloroflexi bacterium]|nr:type II toxin-antitoxin system HicA family toxin [Chloroflexota bacterium]
MKLRAVVTRLRQDGWYVARTSGSHKVWKHPTKKGIVIIAGRPSKDVAPGTLKSIWKQAELEG